MAGKVSIQLIRASALLIIICSLLSCFTKKPRSYIAWQNNDPSRVFPGYDTLFQDSNYCHDSQVYLYPEIYAINYNRIQTKSLLILAFEKNSNFKVLLDSFTVVPVPEEEEYERYGYCRYKFPYWKLNCYMDLQLIFRDGNCFEITDLQQRRMKFSGDVDTICGMYSYKINGQTIKSNQITLFQPLRVYMHKVMKDKNVWPYITK